MNSKFNRQNEIILTQDSKYCMISLYKVPRKRDSRTEIAMELEEEDLAFNVYRGSIWDAEDVLDRDGGDG